MNDRDTCLPGLTGEKCCSLSWFLQQRYRIKVRGRHFECSCQSILLRQDVLAVRKALSSLQDSPALLKELRLAMARRKKELEVRAGRRSITSGSGYIVSQQLAGKRKTNEPASSGNSKEPTNRRLAPGAGSVSLSATSAVRANKLLPAAGNTDNPGDGQLTRMHWPGPSPHLSQVGR